ESLLGAHAAGGALWSYDRDSAFGLLDQGGAPKPDLMQAVARPYARVVGGNPVATSYDFAARTLSLHFRNRGGVEPWSVVYVGDHYAGGLRVTARDADGARVARDAAAGEIKVRVDPDIQEHVITLSPRSAP
ncbi:MAG: hypothetical protein HYZ27_03650, partial [Deltaproteobacteria bacterium]|nr:hypothetical protein [Deltaproteobacteria bacterium]